MDAKTFVAGLVAEMKELFAGLGERGALEAESQGRVEVVNLLRLALRSELEAAELAGFWLPTTPEIDVKMLFAGQCADEMKHFRLISDRLAELGAPVGDDAAAAPFGPLYGYLQGLRTTVERVAAGPFAREAIAEVRNAQFIAFCERSGDERTARLYRDVIQPDELHHHRAGRVLLEKYCSDAESQRLAEAATRTTLAIADELSLLARKTTGSFPIPAS
jgi:1,2-phenylacetyl-CoA epoxidase catalytic subunit